MRRMTEIAGQLHHLFSHRELLQWRRSVFEKFIVLSVWCCVHISICRLYQYKNGCQSVWGLQRLSHYLEDNYVVQFSLVKSPVITQLITINIIYLNNVLLIKY